MTTARNNKTAAPRRQRFNTRTTTFIVLAAAAVVAMTIGACHYQWAQQERAAADTLFAQRDFRLIPFDEYDATQVCRHKAARQFGDTLVRAHVDDRSTRFEPERNIFVVSLLGNVGTPRRFEDVFIYCYVDPREHTITYYDTVFAEKRSLMSRALRFFN